MKYYSGLYFIANKTGSHDSSVAIVDSLVQGIENHPTAKRQQTPWSLSYQLFRDVPWTPGDPHNPQRTAQENYQHKYQHLLHVSLLSSNRSYRYLDAPSTRIQPSPVIKVEPGTQAPTPQTKQATASAASSPGSIIAIPVQQQEEFCFVEETYMQALWNKRHNLSVQQGITYTTGQFRVHIGLLRVIREQHPGVSSPGVVVCMDTLVGSDEQDDTGFFQGEDGDGAGADESRDFEPAQALIRELWSTTIKGREFGKADIRSLMLANEDPRGNKENEQNAVVRLWCELLRLKG